MGIPEQLMIFARGSVCLEIKAAVRDYEAHHPGGYGVFRRSGENHFPAFAQFSEKGTYMFFKIGHSTLPLRDFYRNLRERNALPYKTGLYRVNANIISRTILQATAVDAPLWS